MEFARLACRTRGSLIDIPNHKTVANQSLKDLFTIYKGQLRKLACNQSGKIEFQVEMKWEKQIIHMLLLKNFYGEKN